jgi:hypothetical protein
VLYLCSGSKRFPGLDCSSGRTWPMSYTSVAFGRVSNAR